MQVDASLVKYVESWMKPIRVTTGTFINLPISYMETMMGLVLFDQLLIIEDFISEH